MTEQEFSARVDHFADAVDRELERLLAVKNPLPELHGGAIYSLGLDVPDRAIRGKRVRPALCLLAADALGVDPKRAMAFACAIELLHNFALVHDDIEDGDEMRRGRPATWIRHGLAHGINIGDYMLGKVFSILLRDQQNDFAMREKLAELLQDTLEDLFAGQSLDISARHTREFSMQQYETLVAKKTGSYLVAPIIGGALIGGANETSIAAIQRFGQSMGPLFQIKDDLIDLTTGKGRGEIGSDIREGKRSFLVAHVLERCSAGEREILFDILNAPREKTTDAQVSAVVDLFHRHGAIAAGETRCGELMREGIVALAAVKESSLKQVLTTAAKALAVRRS
ncbi:short chain isoprenyl diphosphate synthase IdsA [soil metagenome]